MKKSLYVFFLIIVLFGSFWVGSWYNQRQTAQGDPSNAKPTPLTSYVRPTSETVVDADVPPDLSSLPPGSIKISPAKQQAIGVRIAPVGRISLTHTLRILGRVAADETRIYRINATVDGWITEALPHRVGSLVKKDEKLASFYSTEIISAQQSYFVYVLGGTSTLSQPAQVPGKEALLFGSPRTSVQQYRDVLKNLGMSEAQIDEISRTRQFAQRVHILSPATGFILIRNVSQGERFEKGKELYRIADLSRAWIQADIFENEAGYLKAGTKVKVRLTNQDTTLEARIGNVLPLFDSTTRTLKVGIEADNPNFILRPDMFVDVELPIQLPPAIAIPADAILDSGIKKTVFVDQGNGIFEPREVETGWRIGNRVEIVKGLEPGEKIVVSGNFLIDSESKLEMAALGMAAAMSKDPICGLQVSVKKAEKAGLKVSHMRKIYYFDSEECRQKFQKEPKRYAEKPGQADSSPKPPPSAKPKETKGHGHG